MSFHGSDLMGASLPEPTLDEMRELLSQLDRADGEHTDVSVVHESGWSLSVFASGLVVWENVESEVPPQHQRDVPRDRALDLWLRLARGDIESIAGEPWRPGYGAA